MEKKNLSIIAAVSQNYAIGSNNDLLWRISDDLKHFKELTKEHTVIMGRKTYDSLYVKPLPNRRNIVITGDMDLKLDGCIMAHSVNEALNLCISGEETFIIGGGEIYKTFMPISDTLYITWVYENFDAQIYFPEINPMEWNIVDQSEIFTDEKQNLQYAYFTYKRRVH